MALAACGDDETYDPNEAVSLETAVSPGQVGPGERAAVTCTRLNGKGEPLPGGAFTIGVAPLDVSFVDGSEVFSNTAGTHQITCSDGELGLIDDTPAPLVVVAGPPVRTTLALAPEQIAAGETAAATCVALDAHGNVAAANLRLEVVPPEGVTVDGATAITGEVAGSYAVTCFAAAVEEAQRATATLTVVPGARAGIALVLEPELEAYGVQQPITVKAVEVDAHGNRRDGFLEVQALDATPAGQHSLLQQNQRIRFATEGYYQITAAAKDDASQTASIRVAVDQTRPVLVVDTPVRAVVTDTLEHVRVSGTVSDNLGSIRSLTVAGQPVSLPPEGGAFQIDIDLAYGLTLMDIVATDAQGLTSLQTRGAEQGLGGFRAMLARTFEQDGVLNALALVLAQAAFDDGEEEEVRDDLAQIIEFIVMNLDFAAFVPNPLTTFPCIGGDCTLALTAVTMKDVDVTMTLQQGRIHLGIVLDDFAGQMTLAFPGGALPATLMTDRVTLDTDIFVSVQNGETVTVADNTVVDIDTLTVTVTGDPTGLLQVALQSAVTLIEGILIGAMEAIITDLVEGQVAEALGGLFDALKIDQDFDLPSPVPDQAPNTIIIRTRAAGVDIAPERLQLRLDALAFAETPNRPHEHLGSLRHTGCAPESALTFPPPAPIVVGVHDDLVNQLLFAVWEGGTLSLDLAGERADALLGDFGIFGATLTVDARLPPVFETCRGDNVVQLAELYIEINASFAGEPLELGLWLLAEAPLDVTFQDDAEGALQAALVIEAIEPMHIEVAKNVGVFATDEDAVRALLRDALIPRLLGTVQESATFTLPQIDLGQMTDAVPPGTIIELDIRQVARDNAYLTIHGALE